MTIKNFLSAAIAGGVTAILSIITIIWLGINTDIVIFGGDKYTIWLTEFSVGVLISVISEVVSKKTSKEVLFDLLVVALVATVLINEDITSWFSFNAAKENPYNVAIHLLEYNFWVILAASLSTPAVNCWNKISSRKFGSD